MAIPKFTEDLNVIASLGDNPKRDNGLSSQQFKAKFDEAPLLLQEYINDVLIPIVENTTPGLYGVTMTLTTATLFVSGWAEKEQKATVSDVIADPSKQAIVATASPDSLETYLDCNIRLIEQEEGELVFACDDVPTITVTVNVLILTNGG